MNGTCALSRYIHLRQVMTDEELREIIDPVSSTLPLALLSSLQPQQLAHISGHTKLAFPVY